MITVKLNGGLGNQMFQYAFGRRLAQSNNAKLKLDTSSLGRRLGSNTLREYALGVFDIDAELCTGQEIKALQKKRFFAKICSIFFGKKYYNVKYYVKEKSHNFSENIMRLRGEYYLDGYWQTEKYFSDIESTIRKEFNFKNDISAESAKIKMGIVEGASVSVHVRRGDYVTNKKANNFHGVCSPAYYARAIEHVIKKIERPVFYVFSDDIGWVKRNLEIDFPVTYVSNGTLKDYEELALMSHCKHNIIANSSFSWWGAWLNSNPDKIVIAPKEWYRDSSKNIDDLIPRKWVVM